MIAIFLTTKKKWRFHRAKEEVSNEYRIKNIECRMEAMQKYPVNQPNPLTTGSDYNDDLSVR